MGILREMLGRLFGNGSELSLGSRLSKSGDLRPVLAPQGHDIAALPKGASGTGRHGFTYDPPASAEDIAALQASLGVQLPDDYVGFLSRSDGGHGEIGGNYIGIWSAEEVRKYNAPNVHRPPGLIVVAGTDDTLLGYDTRDRAWPIVLTLEQADDWEVRVKLRRRFSDLFTQPLTTTEWRSMRCDPL